MIWSEKQNEKSEKVQETYRISLQYTHYGSYRRRRERKEQKDFFLMNKISQILKGNGYPDARSPEVFF